MIDGWMDGADGTQDDTGRPGKLERQITKKAKRIEIPLWVRSARNTKVKGAKGKVGECDNELWAGEILRNEGGWGAVVWVGH